MFYFELWLTVQCCNDILWFEHCLIALVCQFVFMLCKCFAEVLRIWQGFISFSQLHFLVSPASGTQGKHMYISICDSICHSSMKCKLFWVVLDHSFYVPAHSRRLSYISDWEGFLKQPDGPCSRCGWLQESKCWLRWHLRGPSNTVIFCNQVTVMLNQYWWNMHKALEEMHCTQ